MKHRLVDGEIVNLIRQRLKECIVYEGPDHGTKCQKLREDFLKAQENFCIKCKFFLLFFVFLQINYHVILFSCPSYAPRC